MAKSLQELAVESIQRSRQTRVEACGFTFIVRRPTLRERDELRTKVTHQCDILEMFVLGWEGVKNIDLVPGGDGAPAEFSKELFAEWIQDQEELWTPLVDAIVAEFNAYQERLKAAEKK
jgi:hypothetical protein